jgi:Helix-turn-helix domain of resolvase
VSGRPSVLTPEALAEIERLTEQGFPAVEIAAQLGISRRSVMRGRARMGGNGNFAEAPDGRLSEEQLVAVIARAAVRGSWPAARYLLEHEHGWTRRQPPRPNRWWD